LQSNYAQFHARQAEILALAYQDTARAQTMAQIIGASFPILSDPNHAVADAYGVFNLLNDSVDTPSVFVIDPAGRILWSHVGKDASDRPNSAEILAHLPSGNP
jgi:peroxiredoxin